LRLQERMSVDLATTVSACMASHKDVSLQFWALAVDWAEVDGVEC
jgi:hypothetical protein